MEKGHQGDGLFSPKSSLGSTPWLHLCYGVPGEGLARPLEFVLTSSSSHFLAKKPKVTLIMSIQ